MNNKVVHVLGAGVDKPLGMPLAQDLLSEIARFTSDQGEPIVQVLRSKLPHLRFDLPKYAGEQGETFAERLLTAESQDITIAKKKLLNYLKRNKSNSAAVRAFLTVIESLEEIRAKNKLEDNVLETLAKLGDEPFNATGGDLIFETRGINFIPIVRQAFRKIFQQAMQAEEITSQEKDVLVEVALWMMNVEDLLGSLFSGFYTNHLPSQKKYIYLSWLLWAYLRVQMNQIDIRKIDNWPYSYLNNHLVVSLNYTADFFDENIRKNVKFFHGNCSSYIRLDTREFFEHDDRILQANSPDKIADFLKELEMDIDAKKVYIPGIIPPLSLKPVICREYLETWYNCGEMFDDASVIFITGYSFAQVDVHFNDLLRKRRGKRNSKIIVINPDIDNVSRAVSQILGWDFDQLTETKRSGFTCKSAFNLMFVEAKVEHIRPEIIDDLAR